MAAEVTPLDPDSPKGREVAERLTQVLAEIRNEIAAESAAKRPRVTPLDPDSPKGREVTERLTQVLAEIRLAIAARKASAERLAQGA